MWTHFWCIAFKGWLDYVKQSYLWVPAIEIQCCSCHVGIQVSYSVKHFDSQPSVDETLIQAVGLLKYSLCFMVQASLIVLVQTVLRSQEQQEMCIGSKAKRQICFQDSCCFKYVATWAVLYIHVFWTVYLMGMWSETDFVGKAATCGY